ncbi:hypothetical protein Tco_0771934 [Tanacetum coccineum]|uniref:Uncharacterized protein n=1 Tax=Tanacetum coccineum TaxID=301880 RepID=A0ABQ4ZK98_9ASTR
MSMHHLRYELVSLEAVENVAPKDGEIDTDILLIKDDVLREKLLKINLLIAKIEALNANPTPSSDFVLKSPIPVKDGTLSWKNLKQLLSLKLLNLILKRRIVAVPLFMLIFSLLESLKCVYF